MGVVGVDEAGVVVLRQKVRPRSRTGGIEARWGGRKRSETSNDEPRTTTALGYCTGRTVQWVL